MICIDIIIARPTRIELNHVSGKMRKSLTLRMSKLYLDSMDRIIDAGLYSSKSEIVREALREFFERHEEKLWKPE